MKIEIDSLWKIIDVPRPVEEFPFHPHRKWRFDYAWPIRKIAVEIEGGVWIKGRHNHPASMIKEMEKYNEAARLGWRVFRFTPQQRAPASSMPCAGP
jgi:hypothetical protein